MAASAGDLETLGDYREKLLTCAKSGDYLPTTEPRHIMQTYRAFFGELSTVLPVYPGVRQPYVE